MQTKVFSPTAHKNSDYHEAHSKNTIQTDKYLNVSNATFQQSDSYSTANNTEKKKAQSPTNLANSGRVLINKGFLISSK